MASPLRLTGQPQVDPTVLPPTGMLAETLAGLASCRDLSSTSDEPYLGATNWEQRFGFHPSRSHVLRGLTIDPDWNVLELSTGYGSLTRFLGEKCATVDAVEPEFAHAHITRARTADLASVQVFVGDLLQIPDEPFYDLIVIGEMLQYAGAGAADLRPYIDLVSAAARRLAPDGVLVLGMDNKLGVKYLAGAPETHSQRVFNSVEDFVVPGPTRTFSRAELASIFDQAGLTSRILGCFPDHRVTRFVFDTETLSSAAQLLTGVPTFPSPDWGVQRVELADERLVWRSIVQAGLAAELPNSFLVLASPLADHPVWGEDLGGVFFSAGRRAPFVCQTTVEVSGDKIMLRRSRISDRQQRGGYRVEPHDADFVRGEDLLDLIIDVDDQRTVYYLNEWAEMVRTVESRLVPYDLIPQNLVVDTHGRLCVIDDEWRSFQHSSADVLARGVLLLGQQLSIRGPLAGTWPDCETFRDVVTKLGATVGLPADGSWIEAAVSAEAEFQAIVALPGEHDPHQVENAAVVRLYSFLALSIRRQHPLAEYAELQAGAAEIDRLRAETAQAAVLTAAAAGLVAAAEGRAARFMQELHRTEQDLARADAELTRVQATAQGGEWATAEVERMQETISWRWTAALRWVRRHIFPPGRPREMSAGRQPR